MRRITTLKAALVLCGWATVIYAFAAAEDQQVTPFPRANVPPPPGDVPGISAPAGIGSGPMILQLGPPPNLYSPSADFKARVAVLGLDERAASPPSPPYAAPSASCPSLATSALPGMTQYTSEAPVAV